MRSSSALVRAKVGVGPGLGPGPRSWSSLSCDAHSGTEPGAPQADGLDMSHVSSSSASMIPLRAMLAAPVSGSQVASQGSALSTTAGSLLTGTVLGAAPLLRLSSGAAPVADNLLARPLNAAAGTSMPMRQSRGVIDARGHQVPDGILDTASRSNHAIELANFRGGSEAHRDGMGDTEAVNFTVPQWRYFRRASRHSRRRN